MLERGVRELKPFAECQCQAVLPGCVASTRALESRLSPNCNQINTLVNVNIYVLQLEQITFRRPEHSPD